VRRLRLLKICPNKNKFLGAENTFNKERHFD